MISNGLNNSPRSRSRVLSAAVPKISLNLHMMPQTADNHFKKWLFLGLLIFVVMVLLVILVLW